MSASTLVLLDPFDCQSGDFEYYLVQFQHLLTLNSIDEECKIVPLFISSIGADTYHILKEICSPKKPEEKSFSELKALLQEHVARTQFYARDQRPDENVHDYNNALQRLLGKCNFGLFAKSALRDRFKAGKIPNNQKSSAAEKGSVNQKSSAAGKQPENPKTSIAAKRQDNQKSSASGQGSVNQNSSTAGKQPDRQKSSAAAKKQKNKKSIVAASSKSPADKKNDVISVQISKPNEQTSSQKLMNAFTTGHPMFSDVLREVRPDNITTVTQPSKKRKNRGKKRSGGTVCTQGQQPVQVHIHLQQNTLKKE